MRKRERDGKEKWRIWFVRERERKNERSERKRDIARKRETQRDTENRIETVINIDR